MIDKIVASAAHGGRRRPRRRDRHDRRLRHRGHPVRAHRRADRAGRARPHDRQQQRRQRRHGLAAAARRRARAQDRLLVSAAERLVCTSTRSTGPGEIELELVPQGKLAERIRAAGAGIGAFYTPTGCGTLLAEGKETRVIDGRHVRARVPAARRRRADQGADRGDRWGNLVYRKTARNFGPLMATAARLHDRAGARGRATGRARSRSDRDARHLRPPRREVPDAGTRIAPTAPPRSVRRVKR